MNAFKSPEQKAAEAALREQEQAKQAEEDVIAAKEKQERIVQGSVPKCDSSNAKDSLKNAFDNAQFARTANLSAIEVTSIREIAFEPSNKTRVCFGTIVMNNTEKSGVKFKLEDRTDGQFMLTFEVSEDVAAAPISLPAPQTVATQTTAGLQTQVTPESRLKQPAATNSVQLPTGQSTEAETLGKYKVSFDCNKASTTAEKLTCTTNTLSQLDGLLAATYKDRMNNSIYGVDKLTFKGSQLAWGKTKNICTDAACLETAYRNRIFELCEMPVVSGVHPSGDCDAIQN
ncbi:hypothetical protein [Methylotenera sp.]|uniref:lysozyme inhibitor LprI family protein n=1 Tax=Methylotenera sp. TaxID=2051956 RepID=UPI002488AA07|nr:hypothetical protein [Methylotenera sp.]MDI1298785.1 hypothetical protein [Methylotenera sp.]